MLLLLLHEACARHSKGQPASLSQRPDACYLNAESQCEAPGYSLDVRPQCVSLSVPPLHRVRGAEEQPPLRAHHCQDLHQALWQMGQGVSLLSTVHTSAMLPAEFLGLLLSIMLIRNTGLLHPGDACPAVPYASLLQQCCIHCLSLSLMQV